MGGAGRAGRRLVPSSHRIRLEHVHPPSAAVRKVGAHRHLGSVVGDGQILVHADRLVGFGGGQQGVCGRFAGRPSRAGLDVQINGPRPAPVGHRVGGASDAVLVGNGDGNHLAVPADGHRPAEHAVVFVRPQGGVGGIGYSGAGVVVVQIALVLPLPGDAVPHEDVRQALAAAVAPFVPGLADHDGVSGYVHIGPEHGIGGRSGGGQHLRQGVGDAVVHQHLPGVAAPVGALAVRVGVAVVVVVFQVGVRNPDYDYAIVRRHRRSRGTSRQPAGDQFAAGVVTHKVVIGGQNAGPFFAGGKRTDLSGGFGVELHPQMGDLVRSRFGQRLFEVGEGSGPPVGCHEMVVAVVFHQQHLLVGGYHQPVVVGVFFQDAAGDRLRPRRFGPEMVEPVGGERNVVGIVVGTVIGVVRRAHHFFVDGPDGFYAAVVFVPGVGEDRFAPPVGGAPVAHVARRVAADPLLVVGVEQDAFAPDGDPVLVGEQGGDPVARPPAVVGGGHVGETLREGQFLRLGGFLRPVGYVSAPVRVGIGFAALIGPVGNDGVGRNPLVGGFVHQRQGRLPAAGGDRAQLQRDPGRFAVGVGSVLPEGEPDLPFPVRFVGAGAGAGVPVHAHLGGGDGYLPVPLRHRVAVAVGQLQGEDNRLPQPQFLLVGGEVIGYQHLGGGRDVPDFQTLGVGCVLVEPVLQPPGPRPQGGGGDRGVADGDDVPQLVGERISVIDYAWPRAVHRRHPAGVACPVGAESLPGFGGVEEVHHRVHHRLEVLVPHRHHQFHRTFRSGNLVG